MVALVGMADLGDTQDASVEVGLAAHVDHAGQAGHADRRSGRADAPGAAPGIVDDDTDLDPGDLLQAVAQGAGPTRRRIRPRSSTCSGSSTLEASMPALANTKLQLGVFARLERRGSRARLPPIPAGSARRPLDPCRLSPPGRRRDGVAGRQANPGVLRSSRRSSGPPRRRHGLAGRSPRCVGQGRRRLKRGRPSGAITSSRRWAEIENSVARERPTVMCSFSILDKGGTTMLRLGYKASAEQFAPRRSCSTSPARRNGSASIPSSSAIISSSGATRWPCTALDHLDGRARRPTSRIVMGTSVLTPTFRYHPSIVAQSFATLGCLFRFLAGDPGRRHRRIAERGAGYRPAVARISRSATRACASPSC